MKLVVAGGTGFIGKELVLRLLDAGHEIVVLTRNSGLLNINTSDKLKFIDWDARTVSSWADQLTGADAIINLAGEPLAEKRWTIDQKQRILNSRVEATGAIVKAIAEAKSRPTVLINSSAVGYYGKVEQGEVDESHQPGNDFLAGVCAKWEAEAQKAEVLGVRTVILRTGLTLEKDGGLLKKVLTIFSSHAGGAPGSGRQWVSWIHREDLLNIIEFALKTKQLTGPINATTPYPVTMKEFVSTLGKILKKPLWAPVPTIVLKAALGEMAEMLLTGQKVMPTRLLGIGYEFKYPVLEHALITIFK